MKTLLFAKLDEYYNEMVAIRRHLHQHPELSFQEYKTAAYIANYYKQLGIPVRTNVGGNGVVATIQGQTGGKKIAFRADFDALPIQDEKDVPYKSTVPGVMHAAAMTGIPPRCSSLPKRFMNYANIGVARSFAFINMQKNTRQVGQKR